MEREGGRIKIHNVPIQDISLVPSPSLKNRRRSGVQSRVSLFTGLDYWNGLLDWTTGLTQTAIKYLLSVEQKLNVLIQPVTLLMLVP